MPCYHPIPAWRLKGGPRPDGSWPIVFKQGKGGDRDNALNVPCGQCIGCKLERSRQWAIRCMLEASLYEQNLFLTLTYNEKNLPKNGSLVKTDHQEFIRKLRLKLNNQKIRYYMCGEYGEKYSRPHYHLCLFGLKLNDLELLPPELQKGDTLLYGSKTIQECWRKGQEVIGELTFDSAAYTARYCTKLLTGEKRKKYGVKQPEYSAMSRNPGIASSWLEENACDIISADRIITCNQKTATPRYFLNKLKERDPKNYERIKKVRDDKNLKRGFEWQRLITAEELSKIKIKKLKRSYEKWIKNTSE